MAFLYATLSLMERTPTQSHIIDLRKKQLNASQEAPRATVEKKTVPSKAGVLYEWDAPEFTKYERDASWNAILAISSIALTIFFILTKNYLGAVVILFLTTLVYIHSRREPRTVHFTILPLGIEIDTTLHPFEELESFWIFYEPGEIKELSFRTKRLVTPVLGLPLGKTDPVAIRQILLKFLPEQKQEEPIANVLARRLKF